MPPLTIMTITVCIAAIISTILGVALFKEITLDFDNKTGAFGFFSSNNYLSILVFVGFFGGTLCYGIYPFALKFFSPIILCTAFLFEPFISQTLGCLLGLDNHPGLATFIGSFIALIGLYYVGLGG